MHRLLLLEKLQARLLHYYAQVVQLEPVNDAAHENSNSQSRGFKTNQKRKAKYGRAYHSKKGLDAAVSNKKLEE